ncbi:MAG: hypothetical protein WAN35_10320 [Terracidiphilus sp.]
MQQPAVSTSTPHTAAPSFAGLMAALASPGEKFSSTSQKSGRPWEEDELEDDVATLSYESALRAHSRYRSPDVGFGGGENPLAQGASDLLEMLQAQESRQEPRLESRPDPKQEPERETAPVLTTLLDTPAEGLSGRQKSAAAAAPPDAPHPQLSPFEKSLKDASITIRMSKAECEQLHRRAAEAGLTVSAYLRSCTFEAESLRAMVKETMAQLRSASAQLNPAPARGSWLRRLTLWMGRLLNPWQGNQREARA